MSSREEKINEFVEQPMRFLEPPAQDDGCVGVTVSVPLEIAFPDGLPPPNAGIPKRRGERKCKSKR